MTDNVIEVRGLSKTFVIRYNTFYGGIAKAGSKQVLNNLSFEVKKGEIVGIIGKNGCGKSTLMKILSKIMDKDSGSINISGKIASILELGMGFDPELSGRDNVRMKCSLYGLSNQEIDDYIEDIIIFSELGEQIDHPLRTYSSGMAAKLAFSILVFIKCDILIIDEVLSVGDASFNLKCKLAFDKMKKNGRSVIMASHNINTIETMCDRVIWLDNGCVRDSGDPLSVCYRYQSNMTDSLNTVLLLANAGDTISINRAGVMYRDGIDTEKDISKAKDYFEKASSLGNSEAQVNLANLLLKEGDVDNAKLLLEKASLVGNANAIISLSQLHSNDSKVSIFVSKVKELASSGNTRAIKLYADMLFNGVGILKDVAEAIKWYSKCTYNNQALFQLGICYRDGIGIPKDSSKAINYLSMSSEYGNLKARLELANTYRRGIGVQRDMDKAIYWYEQAALSGDSRSMLELGTIYRDGLGVESNPEKSLLWFKRYSDLIIGNYENALGDILFQGYSGQLQRESLIWYSQASKDGNINAAFNYANIYRDGKLTIPDLEKSHQYYSISAQGYHSGAIFELGLLYIKGIGVPIDLDKGFDLIKKSAFMGNRSAMAFLMNTCFERTDYNQFQLINILNELGDLSARAIIDQHDLRDISNDCRL